MRYFSPSSCKLPANFIAKRQFHQKNTWKFILPGVSSLILPGIYTFKTTYKRSFLHPFSYHLAWLCPRPISNGQLHTLLYFHLRPIYLVVFKGSY